MGPRPTSEDLNSLNHLAQQMGTGRSNRTQVLTGGPIQSWKGMGGHLDTKLSPRFLQFVAWATKGVRRFVFAGARKGDAD